MGQGDRFIEAAPQSRSLMPAPRFTFGPVTAELNRFHFSETTSFQTGCVILRGAGVASDGIPYRDGTLLTEPLPGLGAAYFTARLGGAMPGRIRRYPGRAVCLSGPGYLIYGHWLVDILPKLFLLHRAGIDLAEETLVLPEDTPGFGLAWMRLLGVQPKRVVTYHPKDEVVVFDELVLPLPVRTNSRTSPLFAPAARYLADAVPGLADHPSPVGSDRMYLSRQRSGRLARMMTNWDELEAVARQYGFQVVYPEAMPLLDQLAMFRSARMLVGQYGSAMHGSMFAPPGCAVCVLRGTEIHPGFLQTAMCDAAGQPIGYVFGQSAFEADGTETFAPDPQDLGAALHAMNVLVG